MSKTIAAVLLLAATAFAARPAAADPAATAAPVADPASTAPSSPLPALRAEAPEPKMSINANPLAIIQGQYGGNFEYLVDGTHGLLVEADYWHSSGTDSSAAGGGLRLGYRWHWRGRQDSGFLGVNVGAGLGTGSATVSNDAGQQMTYDLSVRTLEVTGDIGKRWMMGPVNITFRIGAGYASRTASTSSTDPDAQKAARTVQDILAFLPVALDGELSVGYTF